MIRKLIYWAGIGVLFLGAFRGAMPMLSTGEWPGAGTLTLFVLERAVVFVFWVFLWWGLCGLVRISPKGANLWGIQAKEMTPEERCQKIAQELERSEELLKLRKATETKKAEQTTKAQELAKKLQKKKDEEKE